MIKIEKENLMMSGDSNTLCAEVVIIMQGLHEALRGSEAAPVAEGTMREVVRLGMLTPEEAQEVMRKSDLKERAAELKKEVKADEKKWWEK